MAAAVGLELGDVEVSAQRVAQALAEAFIAGDDEETCEASFTTFGVPGMSGFKLSRLTAS